MARVLNLFAASAALALPWSCLAQGNASEAFDTIRSVLQHPRCQNCHIPGDSPLQLNEGRVHQMNVQRGPDGHGAVAMECAACHGVQNLPESYGLHVPPGAPNWHLPPPQMKMVFKDLSAGELCATIKDSKRTGGKDLPAMLAHVRDDKLVAWGWDPGLGRDPVPIPRTQFVAAWKAWMDAGAPCPAP
ncbi:MAG TPA: hypothetical protein VKR38_00475 [Usitatibacter sp.]|nr:hypothetical protein [Usitatibacter sp.]